MVSLWQSMVGVTGGESGLLNAMKLAFGLTGSARRGARLPSLPGSSRSAALLHPALPGVLLVSLALSGGCGQSDIKIYRVAKAEAKSPGQQTAAAASLPSGHPDLSTASGSPALKWTLPAGWEEVAAGEMRVASFRVKGSEGKQADVSIVPLPGMAGGDSANVNRWRSQLGLEAVSDDELAKLAQPVQIGGQPAKLYEQAGKIQASGDAARILGAIQHRSGSAWFFKMTGDDDLVAKEKPAFIEFLKSLSFAGASPGELPASHPEIGSLPPSHPPLDGANLPQGAAGSDSAEAKPKWQVPSGWQEASPSQFIVAKYLVHGPGETQAAITASSLSGTGGGPAANVNRWRGQLGLTPLAPAELEKQAQSLELPSGKAMLVDMTGTDARTGNKARLVAAIVPLSDRTWFYKLMGEPQLVAKQKSAFEKFVKTASYK